MIIKKIKLYELIELKGIDKLIYKNTIDILAKELIAKNVKYFYKNINNELQIINKILNINSYICIDDDILKIKDIDDIPNCNGKEAFNKLEECYKKIENINNDKYSFDDLSNLIKNFLNEYKHIIIKRDCKEIPVKTKYFYKDYIINDYVNILKYIVKNWVNLKYNKCFFYYKEREEIVLNYYNKNWKYKFVFTKEGHRIYI